MSLVAGVELTPTHVRVVLRHAITGAVRATHEAAWDPQRPHLVVAALRTQLPTPRHIGLAIAPAFLRTAIVTLPPVSPVHRQAMLALEPDRFFLGATAPTTIALSAGPSDGPADLAFAIDTAHIAAWIDAFSDWAPVDGVKNADAAAVATPGGLAPQWLAAAGATGAIDAAPPYQLMPSAQLAQRTRRRQRQVVGTAVMLGVALVLLIVAMDRSRQRTLEALETALARQQAATATVQGELDRLTQLAQEREAVRSLRDTQRNPVATLGAVSAVLPRGATVMRLRMAEGGWQVDGSATDAAAVIRAFEQDPRFTEVRVLSATTRFTDQGRARESFSIGFHAAP